MLAVRDRLILNSQLRSYSPLDPKEFPLQSVIADLKRDMLLHGATPEAVCLVGAVSPFTKKELNTMAEKLKKAATKKPATKKAAAPKKEKAAASPRSAFDDKAKITLTDKGEAKLKKGGDSGAVKNLEIMKKSKTVGKALEAGLKGGDLSYASNTGTVVIG